MAWKWNRFLFAVMILIGIVTITISLNASAWLPAYDPYTFTDDFSDPTLNSNLWWFVPSYPNSSAPKGTYSIQDSQITLNTPTGGVGFLGHSYLTFWPSGVSYGASMGSVEFSVRFNNLSDRSVSLELAKIDSGWVGIVNSQIIYYDEIAGAGHLLQNGIDSNWHSCKIQYGYSGREVYWDGRLAVSVPTVQRFTLLILGHPDIERSGGGSASYTRVRSVVGHGW